jgi:predicted deacetylase
MSNHESRINKNADGEFYALIVRIERDGEENVIHGYKGRHFKTEKAAIKSTAAYINKNAS